MNDNNEKTTNHHNYKKTQEPGSLPPSAVFFCPTSKRLEGIRSASPEDNIFENAQSRKTIKPYSHNKIAELYLTIVPLENINALTDSQMSSLERTVTYEIMSEAELRPSETYNPETHFAAEMLLSIGYFTRKNHGGAKSSLLNAMLAYERIVSPETQATSPTMAQTSHETIEHKRGKYLRHIREQMDRAGLDTDAHVSSEYAKLIIKTDKPSYKI